MAIKPIVYLTVDTLQTHTNNENKMQKKNRRNFDRPHFALQINKQTNTLKILEERAFFYRLKTRLSVIQ
jgi:hypothetical protein